MYLINKPVHLVVLLLLTLLRVMVSLPGILHGAGLWQLPKQLYLPADEKSAQAANSHLKYVWYDPRAVHRSCGHLCYFPPARPQKWDMCSCICFSWIPSRICCSFSPTYFSFSLSCLKKPWRVDYAPPPPPPPPPTLIPHMVASLPSLVLIKPC